MLALIITFLLGLGIAYFAVQNTKAVTITLANSPIPDVPIYILVIGSILLGIFVSWIISLAGALSSSLTIHSKDQAIQKDREVIEGLRKQIHDLELENANLKGTKHEKVVVEHEHEPTYKHNFWDRLLGRHRFA